MERRHSGRTCCGAHLSRPGSGGMPSWVPVNVGANPVVTIHERMVGQRLSGRTRKLVLRGIVRKRAGEELGVPALRVALHRPPVVLPRPVEVHSVIGGRLHRGVIGVVAVSHHLFGLASQRSLAAFQCRLHLPVVDGIGGRLDV